MPGFAGRQAGISLKGEASDHKGSFGETFNPHPAWRLSGLKEF
jgi:hypothetical protein